MAIFFIFLSPLCNTHSRAVFANILGPAPVRDAFHPRGFVNLSPVLRKKAEGANVLRDFAVQVLYKAAESSTLAVLKCRVVLKFCPAEA